MKMSKKLIISGVVAALAVGFTADILASEAKATPTYPILLQVTTASTPLPINGSPHPYVLMKQLGSTNTSGIQAQIFYDGTSAPIPVSADINNQGITAQVYTDAMRDGTKYPQPISITPVVHVSGQQLSNFVKANGCTVKNSCILRATFDYNAKTLKFTNLN